MIQDPIRITSKNGTEYIFKTPHSNEAQVILESMAEIAESSPYILSTSESFRSITLESQAKWLEDSKQSDVSIIIGVYDSKDRIVGFCNGRSYSDIKRKHRASLGVSVHPEIRGHGVGKKLMEVLIENMKQFRGIKIIELDVMTQNLPAVRMYENLGFKKAGVFPSAFILTTGETVDNLTMYLEI